MLIAVNCGAPEDITNGKIRILHALYKSVIIYSCDYGFVLVGKQNRTCQVNGVWSGQPPSCAGNISTHYKVCVWLISCVKLIVMDCGSPGFPENGDSIVGETTYNSTVTHICREGYILIGDKNRTCFGNGTWSGIFPECKREFNSDQFN